MCYTLHVTCNWKSILASKSDVGAAKCDNSAPDLRRPCHSTKLNHIDCVKPLSKKQLLAETHRTEASVAVGPIEQSELIVEVHRTETSVAVIPNEHCKKRQSIDNYTSFSLCFAMVLNMQNTLEMLGIMYIDMLTSIMLIIANIPCML